MTQNTRLSDRVLGWLRRRFAEQHSNVQARRGPVDHVIILDGTMSSLEPGYETNAGRSYLLLKEQGEVSIFYEAGVQWTDWRTTSHVATGRGINRQIRRAYGYLASRYHEGDRIYLLGYSRGAYAVRSLAGMIDRVGLLRRESATERNITQAYRLYQFPGDGAASKRFHSAYCHADTPIEMVGVWDTVKALGLRLPVVWRLSEPEHAFHNHALGPSIKAGFHALALDENRQAYAPVLWACPPGHEGHVEQVWFRGTHADVGGQIGDFKAARPLANIPLVWMLGKLESCGLTLPEGWAGRFEQDVTAPSSGRWMGVSKLFLLRKKRIVGRDASESLHDTVLQMNMPESLVVPKEDSGQDMPEKTGKKRFYGG